MANSVNPNSRRIESNQNDVHDNLEKIVTKHLAEPYRKPISMHTLLAFDEMAETLERKRVKSVVLDSGCGAGDSTIVLAKKYPESTVIGIDKSQVRLQKLKNKDVPDNACFVRADQFDFWRLIVKSGFRVHRHYILYPNPWPKKSHGKRRIFGHPAFVFLPRISKNIEIRSNWLIYLKEFANAWELATGDTCQIRELEVTEPISLFEKKFNESGHTLYRLTTFGEL